MDKLVVQRYTLEDDCPICCDSMNDTSVIRTPCNHYFHESCLTKQFEGTHCNRYACAVCRKDLRDYVPSELRQSQAFENMMVERLLDESLWENDIVVMIAEIQNRPITRSVYRRAILSQISRQSSFSLVQPQTTISPISTPHRQTTETEQASATQASATQAPTTQAPASRPPTTRPPTTQAPATGLITQGHFAVK